MYQSVHDMYHQKISKGVAESLLVKTNIEMLNNYSTLARNNSSLENAACKAGNERSQNTESRQIQDNNSLSGGQRGDNKSAQ